MRHLFLFILLCAYADAIKIGLHHTYSTYSVAHDTAIKKVQELMHHGVFNTKFSLFTHIKLEH